MTATNNAREGDGVADDLRRICGHDSWSVDGCVTCKAADIIEAAIQAQQGAAPKEAGGYQERVGVWMDACFPRALYGDMTQRCDRFLEESLELLQAMGYDRGRVVTLVDYVWGRPVGHAPQEVGGTVVTLAALCWVAGMDMQGEADRELARIEQPEVMAKIQAKQQAKNALHFDSPLPGNAANPPVDQRQEGARMPTMAECPICQKWADKFGPCGFHARHGDAAMPTREAASPPEAAAVDADKGPWVWHYDEKTDTGAYTVRSCDFNYDVIIEVSGDFANHDDVMRYMAWLRDKLNAPALAGVPAVDLTREHNERLLDLDYAAVCLTDAGYQFTAAAKVKRVRDWLAATHPAGRDAKDAEWYRWLDEQKVRANQEPQK